MSQRIAILPENLTNKIAAGEVVERPASVIKELLENALDAGASHIQVEIAAGGRRLIRVTDNGSGMSREDALLSLERHATSKIRHDADLDGILTLGFRGEALPSIASVSRFRLASREPGSAEGTEIIVEGGRVRDVKACGMASGTVVTVEQLFFNLPARLKFMRSAETEGAHVADTLTRMALSRPDVSFTCLSDGKELLRVQRGDLQRRLIQLLGKTTAAGLHELPSANGDVRVSGFISGPAAVRSTAGAMFTYINGRFVRDRVVQHAVMQAYRGVIDRGRYPVVALFIKLAPGEVDVNVHPTKHEVRFRHQTLIHDAIQSALENVLRASPWLTQRERPDQPAVQPAAASPSSQAYRDRIAAAAQKSLELGRSAAPPRTSQPLTPAATLSAAPTPPTVREPAATFAADPAGHAAAGHFAAMTVIGQFHGEYILCQSGAELVIIDQHAASERVAFQRLRQQCAAGAVESQRLLFPETIELTFAEAALATRFKDDLAGLGFDIEPFGGATVMLAAIPRFVPNRHSRQLLRDILEDLAHLGASNAFVDAQEALLARIACHAVIRGHHPLTPVQIAALLQSMDETEFAASCPHGRPVFHVITLSELEKIFKRT